MRAVRFSSAARRFSASLVLVAALSVAAASAATPPVGVAVLRGAPWSPNDGVREGAAEFEVLLRVAQLQRAHRVAGIVSVGDRHGARACGGESALRRAALTGVPVVKIAPGGVVAPAPDDLFLDAGSLDEARASAILLRCLAQHGAPPAVADPAQPTRRELAAIRAHLQPFRQAFADASVPRLAAN